MPPHSALSSQVASLTERDEPFSNDDFATNLGEYRVRIDKHHRLIMPHELIRDLDPPEGMVQLLFDDDFKLIINNPDLDESDYDTDIILAQIDKKSRILLPGEIWKSLRDKQPLTGSYDELKQNIILIGVEKSE